MCAGRRENTDSFLAHPGHAGSNSLSNDQLLKYIQLLCVSQSNDGLHASVLGLYCHSTRRSTPPVSQDWLHTCPSGLSCAVLWEAFPNPRLQSQLSPSSMLLQCPPSSVLHPPIVMTIELCHYRFFKNLSLLSDRFYRVWPTMFISTSPRHDTTYMAGSRLSLIQK